MFLKLSRHSLQPDAYVLIIVSALSPATFIRHTATHLSIRYCKLHTTLLRLTIEYC